HFCEHAVAIPVYRMPDESPQQLKNGSARNGSDILLRFDNVTVSFDEVVALDRVSFEIRPAETKVVLGAAGSGKTTLLKTAIGLIRPDTGCVFLFGRDIKRMKERELFDLRAK